MLAINLDLNWKNAKIVGLLRGIAIELDWCKPWIDQIKFIRENTRIDNELPYLIVIKDYDSRKCQRDDLTNHQQQVEYIQNYCGAISLFTEKRPVIALGPQTFRELAKSTPLASLPIGAFDTEYHPDATFGSISWTFWLYRLETRVGSKAASAIDIAFNGNSDAWSRFREQKRSK